MSEDQDQKKPSGRFGNWRRDPLVGQPGEAHEPPRPGWPGQLQPSPAHVGGPEDAGDVSRASVSIGHELDGIHFRPIVIFVIGVMLLTGLALVVVTVLQMAAGGGSLFPLRLPEGGVVARAVTPNDQAIPENALARAIPVLEIAEIRAMENELLNNYAYVDRQAGTVRIPIDRAIELLAQRGLPTRPNAQPFVVQPVRPSDSNSGRSLETGR